MKYVGTPWDALQEVAATPERWRLRPDIYEGCRARVFQSHLIIYRVHERAVQISRILHGAMNLHEHMPHDFFGNEYARRGAPAELLHAPRCGCCAAHMISPDSGSPSDFAETIRKIFSPDGLLSEAKSFEYQPEQQEKAVAVADACAAQEFRHLRGHEHHR